MSLTVENIFEYFPNLTEKQKEQIAKTKEIYHIWNEQINVISRKDMDYFFEHHILHSLAIAKVLQFKEGTKVLDIGTGGGFPGVPLAILFPQSDFFLVDSIGKKIKVVNEVAQYLGIKNIRTAHERAENINEKFDFIVSRAVTQMPDFLKWTKGKFLKENKNELENGILYLKGGDLIEEMESVRQYYKFFDIKYFFKEEFFETKKVVYVKC